MQRVHLKSAIISTQTYQFTLTQRQLYNEKPVEHLQRCNHKALKQYQLMSWNRQSKASCTTKTSAEELRHHHWFHIQRSHGIAKRHASAGRRVFKPAQVTLHRHLVPWFTIRTHTRSPHTSHCVCFPSACVTVCVLSIFVWRRSIFVCVQACVYFYVSQHVCVWMCESLKWLCMFFSFFIYIGVRVFVCVRARRRVCEVWIERSCDQMGSTDQVTCL